MALQANSPAIKAGNYALIPKGITADQRESIVFTGTLTSGSKSVSGIASTTGLEPGMPIAVSGTGTGIPAGTTIVTVINATSITLSNSATASGSTGLTATPSRTHGTGTATTVDIGAYEYTDPPIVLDPLATYYTVEDTSSNASGNDNIQAGNGSNKITAGASGSLGNIQVTLGSGAGDLVTLLGNGNDQLTAGNGNNDSVSISGNGNDQVTLGSGNNDSVSVSGNGNDKVTLGNGNNDSVSISGNGNDQITVGNGTGDAVVMVGNGNDNIQTGTGSGTVHTGGTGKYTVVLGSKGWIRI